LREEKNFPKDLAGVRKNFSSLVDESLLVHVGRMISVMAYASTNEEEAK
jgi:hypothetical protein